MALFVKTRLHVVSAVLILLGLYSIAGLAWSLWMHSEESVIVWVVIVIVAFAGAFANQAWIAKKRRRTQ